MVCFGEGGWTVEDFEKGFIGAFNFDKVVGAFHGVGGGEAVEESGLVSIRNEV